MIYWFFVIDYSVYIHIPFCRHRCCYCDFNTYAGLETLIPQYADAICNEIRYLAAACNSRLSLQTVYFGGGTPSLLPANNFQQILDQIRYCFDLQPGAEISLEANPGTLSYSYLADLRSTGVNRLSLGVQSANVKDLRFLEREHDFGDVIRAVHWARQAGFDNINLDLIFGLPYQSYQSWQETLQQAIDLSPDHFSLYCLTIEQSTPLGVWVDRGLVEGPDPDLAADMYNWASIKLAQHGFLQYEISNWAKAHPENVYACQHNLQYWRNLPYLGIGAGAHGYIEGFRTVNMPTPWEYIQHCMKPQVERLQFPRSPATQSIYAVELSQEMSETMIMGLRLVNEGVSDRSFRPRFGRSIWDVFGEQIDRLEKDGLIEHSEDAEHILRLTPLGHLLGNRVFIEFV